MFFSPPPLPVSQVNKGQVQGNIKNWFRLHFRLVKGLSACTHTHARTHTCCFLWFTGTLHFILYKLYVLLPYTYPTPKLSPHRRDCEPSMIFMIYKRFELWGHWKCPHTSPSPCNTCHTHVIIQIFVLINNINMHTHTHTHPHKSNAQSQPSFYYVYHPQYISLLADAFSNVPMLFLSSYE